MSMESDLRDYLLSKSAITDIVGTAGVYDQWIDQGDPLPALTILRFTGGHDHDLDGAAGSAAPLVQIDAWTADTAIKDTLCQAVRNALQGFGGGDATANTVGDTHFQSITFDDERDLSNPPVFANDRDRVRRMLQYRIRYVESVPTFS